jgi:hypothetical protein
VQSLTPDVAAAEIEADLVVGSAAEALVEARGHGRAVTLFPSAAQVLRQPKAQRTLEPRPAYARAPDAKPSVAA